ncbi:SDR family NAD(P)-dependent oxidoreductase [Xenorhabdus bovienii]|uniref:SDR family NAD(P)-dependent oxidoreductase n=1 Tax=Xenorhabdus bovienii TaxID=40576 RepID=A0AAJ1JA77_XENBV|nr:SDR family NAD(P)-dependent oxidoreductase [Xenorhabdus bovienii]MDE1479721.1 SDR family NAD(P)-dependent oxidoreductase [Xenorhabdus bovienii]MDE1491162.1 SDR family NAD(P)-dependent oxidoreductase [Xenorhabdus bovienii]MDE9511540.1 SDR family NAD(P)-dependent oxidoreductase [Xenorhabdus bovienii]MDE9523169.1 SDR family NAD(P)-dependent oxidoreductase [Xenorhabdus bovienii]
MNTWVVSGCSNGLGRCWTDSIIRERHDRVIGITRSEGIAREMVELYQDRFIPCIADVRDEQTLAGKLPALAREVGIPNRIVTSAGYAQFGTLEDLSTQQLREQFETNVEGTLNVIKPLLPFMRKLPEARILVVSSMSGVACWPLLGAYQISKYAIEAIGETLRLEFDSTQIQVGIIEPGPYKTGWATTSARRENISDAYDEDTMKKRAACGFTVEEPKVSLPFFWKMFDTPVMPVRIATSAPFVDLVCVQAEEKIKVWRKSFE